MQKKAVLTILALVLVVVPVIAVHVRADPPRPPSTQDVEFAERTAELLRDQLLSALVEVFSQTTPHNVEEGSQAISLIFDDSHNNFRLVGNLEPLGDTGFPRDDFEETALELALQGQGLTEVERVTGRWFYRASLPLSNFDASCSMCHTNFGPVDPGFYTGALMLKVPIERQVGRR